MTPMSLNLCVPPPDYFALEEYKKVNRDLKQRIPGKVGGAELQYVLILRRGVAFANRHGGSQQ